MRLLPELTPFNDWFWTSGADGQLRGQAGDRQVPGDPRVGYTQLYGAPGVAGVSILSL